VVKSATGWYYNGGVFQGIRRETRRPAAVRDHDDTYGRSRFPESEPRKRPGEAASNKTILNTFAVDLNYLVGTGRPGMHPFNRTAASSFLKLGISAPRDASRYSKAPNRSRNCSAAVQAIARSRTRSGSRRSPEGTRSITRTSPVDAQVRKGSRTTSCIPLLSRSTTLSLGARKQ